MLHTVWCLRQVECGRWFGRGCLAGVLLAIGATLPFTALADKPETPGSSSKNGNGKVSPVQSSARPLGLSIVGPVMQAGSDTASKSFQNTLPSVQQAVLSYLPESQNNLNSPLLAAIDPSKLTLSTASDVRAYFVYEGASYHDTIGFNTTGVGVSSGNPAIIFPDASSSVGYGGDGKGKRSASQPLLPGDFVNLGTIGAGSTLDFFLIANGANGGSDVFSTTASANPDGISHAAAFSSSFWAAADSPYLFVSFEDLYGGGDQDFNDVVIALDIGKANVAALLATPEPGTWLMLGSFLGLVVLVKRQRTVNKLPPVAAV